jgi:hypothetical protein
MYEEQRWCTDVLDQIAAVRSALNGIALLVVEDHLTGCMTATGESSGAAVSDLLSVLRRDFAGLEVVPSPSSRRMSEGACDVSTGSRRRSPRPPG